MMNKKFSILTAVFLLCGLIVFFTSCKKKDTPVPIPVATTIELVSGGSQSAITEGTLENPVVILVKDQNGDAFEGATVNFAVSEGSVSAASATTNASGNTSVTWTLGTTEDTQTLTVSGVGTPLSVTATGTYRPVIGGFYQDGVIFYIDETEAHGLICAVVNQSYGAPWGCEGDDITGAEGTATGTGAQNTIDIEAECTIAGTAADLCANLTTDNYSDWFLPSIDELHEMYLNKVVIDATCVANDGAALNPIWYWNSTESSSTKAKVEDMYDGSQADADKSSGLIYTRAVRTF